MFTLNFKSSLVPSVTKNYEVGESVVIVGPHELIFNDGNRRITVKRGNIERGNVQRIVMGLYIIPRSWDPNFWIDKQIVLRSSSGGSIDPIILNGNTEEDADFISASTVEQFAIITAIHLRINP